MSSPTAAAELSAKQPAFAEIPVVDISGLFSDDADALREVADHIGDACRNAGFFYVSNHGVPASLVEPLLEQTQRFFALPMEEKLKYDITELQRHRGFVPFGGLFTILLQDDVGGLQVMNTTGEWIEAPPIPDTFVINIGDMLMRWSNGEFRSTPHRVINTSARERYSFPMFVAANYDAIVRSLDSCTGPGRPAKYPPIQQGLWTVNQITDAYEYRRAYRGKVPGAERSEPL